MHQRLAALTLFLTYLTIILGAATRVFDAGMSCPDWPTCYGVWNPFHIDAVPVGGYVVNGVTYSVFQVALEWSHRLCAALVGFGLVGLIVGALRRAKYEWPPLLLALGLLVLQIKLGAVTVWMNNVNWSVAIHLGNAMLMFGALAWYGRVLRAGPPPYKVFPVGRMYVYTVLAAAVSVLVTMMVGAFVSSSHMGGVCGGLWSCGGDWLPRDAGQHMHMLHRFMALGVFVLSVMLMVVGRRQAIYVHGSAVAFHMMVWGQVVLGVLTLYSFTDYADTYELLSLTHLAWGTLVWMVAVGLVLNLKYGKAGRAHG